MLQFKPITLQDIQEIRPYLDKQSYRTCDFTVGGIYMWIDFFHYEYCIDHGLLFIKGKAEDEPDKASFAVPIGDASVRQGIELLREYCSNRQIPLLLSAVPQEAAEQLAITYSTRSQQLPDWSDYLFIRIGEELEDIDTRGSFWDNPFDLGISRSIIISDPTD